MVLQNLVNHTAVGYSMSDIASSTPAWLNIDTLNIRGDGAATKMTISSGYIINMVDTLSGTSNVQQLYVKADTGDVLNLSLYSRSDGGLQRNNQRRWIDLQGLHDFQFQHGDRCPDSLARRIAAEPGCFCSKYRLTIAPSTSAGPDVPARWCSGLRAVARGGQRLVWRQSRRRCCPRRHTQASRRAARRLARPGPPAGPPLACRHVTLLRRCAIFWIFPAIWRYCN